MYPFFKTFRSLKKANLLCLMFICAFLAIAVVLAVLIGITHIADFLINIKTNWLDTLVNFIIGALSGIAGWFMLPGLTVFISGMFQEKVIYKIEQTCYPDTVSKEQLEFWPDMLHDIKFTLWALFLNILILPLYLTGTGFIISIILNSYLLGREFFESAAGYHIGKVKAKNLCHQNRKVVYSSGFFITIMNLIPLLNLFVPIIAIV